MSFKCKECGREFGSEAALHRHIKIHDMNLADYYTKNFPRKNLLTGDPLPFKNKDELIDEINKSIDIPIISEKTEKAILEALWKIIKTVFYKKLGI